MQFRVFCRIVRWEKILGPMCILDPLLAAFVAIGFNLDLKIIPLMVFTLACVAAGFALNDITDKEMDKYSIKRRNPLTVGEASLSQAVTVTAGMFILAISMVFFMSLENQLIAGVLLLLFYTYSCWPRVKAHPPWDLIWHVFLFALPVVMGYLAYKPFDSPCIAIFILSGSLSAVAQLVNHVQDYEGDKQFLKTTTTIIGREASLYLCIVLMTSAVIAGCALVALHVIHTVALLPLPTVLFVVKPMWDALTTKNYGNLDLVYYHGARFGVLFMVFLVIAKIF